MAEEILVKDTLSPEMIEAGKKLTEQLDRSSLPVSASMWLYVPESNQWRLILASPKIESEGPKKVYQDVLSSLTQLPEAGLALKDIGVVEPNHPLINLLRVAVRTGSGIAGIRFSRNTINGHFIEDAYIYRL
jgi:hypothetical protein